MKTFKYSAIGKFQLSGKMNCETEQDVEDFLMVELEDCFDKFELIDLEIEEAEEEK